MKLLKLLIVKLALIATMAASAAPILISTSIGDYEIDLIQGETADVSDILEEQVWFGDQSLALEFAGLIYDGFGIVNQGLDGPYFVFDIDYAAQRFLTGFWYSIPDVVGTLDTFFADRAYAVATAVVDVPEPGILSLLGLGMLSFVIVRRNKKV